MTWTYLNGAFFLEDAALVSAADAGLLSAHGVFETFRARSGTVYRLGDHVARMRSGAAVLSIDPPPDLEHLPEIVRELAGRSELPDARVRATLTAGPPGGHPAFVVQARAATDYPDAMYEKGATTVFSPIRRNETSPLSGTKSLNHLDNLLARRQAQAYGALTALLLNTRGAMAEAATANLFIVRDGALLTPPVKDGALPGVTRAAVLELAQANAIAANERSIAPEELLAAGEAFLTGAIMGVMPLVSVDGAAIGGGTPGPVTVQVRDLYEAAVRPPVT